MMNYKNLVHPFQNDPGCSQSQRVLENLLQGSVKIDGRTLADLLGFFKQLSRHVKYSFAEKDAHTGAYVLAEDDWNKFFGDTNIAFVLAGAARHNASALTDKLKMYEFIFTKMPSAPALRLLIYFYYFNTIHKINTLYGNLKNTNLPVSTLLEQQIKNKLQVPVRSFLKAVYTAHSITDIKGIDFSEIFSESIWNIRETDVSRGDSDILAMTTGQKHQLLAVFSSIKNTYSAVFQSLDLISVTAGSRLHESLMSLPDDVRQKQSPHLALLLTFLSMFAKLQEDLNGFSRKHLDFFYKDVLRLEPAEALPDQVHIVFELQKQLKQYALKTGLLLKADKDKNNVEINFSIRDDIVLNKTQVVDVRTLFLNNEQINQNVYVEGAYMALKANTTDGIDKEFTAEPKNYSTLGARYSKHMTPGATSPKPYPVARMGFVLASPVLLLNEGERSIRIELSCRLNNNCTGLGQSFSVTPDPCCAPVTGLDESTLYPSFIDATLLFDAVKQKLASLYVYISSVQIETARKQGLSNDKADIIYTTYLRDNLKKNIFCEHIEKARDKDEAVVLQTDWDNFLARDIFNSGERQSLRDIFKPVRPLKVLFSGEKSWIEPTRVKDAMATALVPPEPLSITVTGDANSFKIVVEAFVGAGEPAITLYNKDVLKEDLGTTAPLVKIELNDHIKLAFEDKFHPKETGCKLLKGTHIQGRQISLYHFFRNVVVNETKIEVRVCGLKNILVQNDESVQDINAPVYPFGTRPAIIDFDAVNSNSNHLDSNDEALQSEKKKRKEEVIPGVRERNLVGPNFYVGSAEVFSKNWNSVCINLNWKEKPKSFNEHYKAYLKRENLRVCNSRVLSEEDKKRAKQSEQEDVIGLDECGFEVNLALLDKGEWIRESVKSGKAFLNPETTHRNRLLFNAGHCPGPCPTNESYEYSFFIEPKDFDFAGNFNDPLTGLKKYDVSARKGFFKITLENQDFLHKDYAFVLARQMMALGRFPDVILENAVYSDGATVIVYKAIGPALALFQKSIADVKLDATAMYKAAKDLLEAYNSAVDKKESSTKKTKDTRKGAHKATEGDISYEEQQKLTPKIEENEKQARITEAAANLTAEQLEALNKLLKIFQNGEPIKQFSVLIPNEPWTPIISNMAIDYTASADKHDVTLIHLYPYPNTYRKEELIMNPPLFPTVCDEGNLYIGLSDVVPGTNVNLFFQLAEATSDTEVGSPKVAWHYLSANSWRSLRTGFEVLRDTTGNLTGSGIVELAIPENITLGNTIMPPEHYWLKASVAKNSKAVCETIAICTQAVKAEFVASDGSDTSRLLMPLKEKSISKLKTADANVKQVTQPFASFNGREPEASGHFYTRVSELLRHKGRAIQKFDYERLVLEAFPQVYKTKCINHSFFLDATRFENDFPIAPGHVLLAVIPDLNRLQSGQSFEPKLPQRIIAQIEDYLSSRVSPFIKIKTVNPRYEKIHIRLSVILKKGFDKTFYKNKLEKDIREYLAPWAVGVFDKLRFGECVNKSDMVYFLETLGYMDYITKLQLQSEFAESAPSDDVTEICPRTPRSILLAGDIQICIEDSDHETWTADDCNRSWPFIDLTTKPVILPI